MFKSYNAKAIVEGINEYSSIYGVFSFKEVKEGTMVTAKVWGLPNTVGHCNNRIFAVHIHEGTSCTGNNADPLADAMSHYNPQKCPHPSHAGDLEPLFSNDGYAYYSFLTNRFKVRDIIR